MTDKKMIGTHLFIPKQTYSHLGGALDTRCTGVASLVRHGDSRQCENSFKTLHNA